MKKKINSVLLASCFLLSLALAGCNSGDKEEAANTTTQVEKDTIKETTEAETTEANTTEAETETTTEEVTKTTEAVTETTQAVTEEVTEAVISLLAEPVFLEEPSIESFIQDILVGSYTSYSNDYTYLEVYQDKVIFYNGMEVTTFTAEQMSSDDEGVTFTDGAGSLWIGKYEWNYDNGTPDDEYDDVDGEMAREQVVNGLPGLSYVDYDGLGEWGAIPVDEGIKELLLKDMDYECYEIVYQYYENDYSWLEVPFAEYILYPYDDDGYGYQPSTVMVFDSEEIADMVEEEMDYYNMTRYGHMFYNNERIDDPEPYQDGGIDYEIAGKHSFVDYYSRYYYSKPLPEEEVIKRNAVLAYLADKNGLYCKDGNYNYDNSISLDLYDCFYGSVNVYTDEVSLYINADYIEQEGDTVFISSSDQWDDASYMLEMTFLDDECISLMVNEYDYVAKFTIEAAKASTPRASYNYTYKMYHFDEDYGDGEGGFGKGG